MHPRDDLAKVAAYCAELVAGHYFDPEAAGRAAAAVTSADYTSTADLAQFAAAITRDLQSAVPDLHLRLKYHPDGVVDLSDEDAWIGEARARADDAMGGVRRVERLAGNVGLLELGPEFFPAEIVGAVIDAAMTVLASAAALIIDLREMAGGSPDTVAVLCSYVLPPRTHLNNMVPRDATAVTQSWTLPWVPGRWFGTTKPIWILTSGRTFSGGEELAFDLQQSGRATIVGEVTGGGANAREGFRVHPHLELAVPVVQARNPITGTNWEGTGVHPDVLVAAADALATAHRLALDVQAANPSLGTALRVEVAAAIEKTPHRPATLLA